MKAVSFGGSVFRIYDETLKVYDQLPAGNYIVRFSEMSGFSLEVYTEFEIKEEKVYGVHNEKVEKVMKAFKLTNRNLGIILSGDKGIGKSLFAKMVCQKASSEGYPVIVIDTYYPGIASYIESIDQEAVILFDEFDKTFGEVKADAGKASPQTNLLSLFDGVSAGKKMFIVTCNNIFNINGYLVNRPGRFHYHLRFDYPEDDEVREYLKDNVQEEYWGEIDNVVAFARRIKLNYDCLRSISFELNMGESFADAIKDLNILNTESETYDVEVKFTNGEIMTRENQNINMMDFEVQLIYLWDDTINEDIPIRFRPIDLQIDPVTRTFGLPREHVRPEYQEWIRKEHPEKVKRVVQSMTVKLSRSKNLHYIL